MLQPVSLSRGFHPGLFCSTPPGWFPDQSHGSLVEGRFSLGSVAESASGSQSDPVSMQTDPIPGTVGDHHFGFRYRRRPRFRSRPRRLQMNGRIPVIQILATGCPACRQSVSAAQRLFNPFRVDASACLAIPGFSPRAFLFHPSGVVSRSIPRQFGRGEIFTRIGGGIGIGVAIGSGVDAD